MKHSYTDYHVNDRKVKDYEKYERTIKTIHKRFKTYGYERIKTPTFEQYDLYASVNSAINRQEMVKLIDRKGDVLVMRPDVTIPITKQLAEQTKLLQQEAKFYYIQDVFRQQQEGEDAVERTQAGVEFFGFNSPEKDAEVIALACHTLKDLGFQQITIEIGHAGFIQSLLEAADVSAQNVTHIKRLIQTKNIPELTTFLRTLQIDEKVIDACSKIPILYGNPEEMSIRAQGIVVTKKMEETLQYLQDVYNILKLYGLSKYIVMDLGLINHMDYYSDIIFQGYVDRYGHPVLMGGRYNRLGHEFGANLPAIGFACTVESLLEAMPMNAESLRNPIDLAISYDQANLKRSIAFANELRERNYIVTTSPMDEEIRNNRKKIYEVVLKENEWTFLYKKKSFVFTTFQQLLTFMREMKG